MGSADVDDIGRRADLAEALKERLRRAPKVVEVRQFGSLAADGQSDQYSDIDLVVVVEEIADRSFAENVPRLLGPLGPQLIAGWGLDRLPDTYIRTI